MNPYFLSFEIMVLSLFALCVAHAARRDRLDVMKLAAGLAFGLLLEWATIQQLHAYTYGRFPLMLGEVPLAIGVGWSVIIYSAGLFSDALDLKPWMRPLMDGLLALNIDLAMDVIAIRLGMWNWGIGPTEQFFGVVYGNFWAWFWVVFFFSAGFRYLAANRRPAVRYAAPIGAVIVGTAGVLATNYLIDSLVSDALYPWTVLALLAGVAGYIAWQRPRRRDPQPGMPVAAMVPLAFHVYFLIAGFASGVVFHPPWILVISLAMLVISLVAHRRELAALWTPVATADRR